VIRSQALLAVALCVSGCGDDSPVPSATCRETWTLREQIATMPPAMTIGEAEARVNILERAHTCDRHPHYERF
jgi:hypothetical protein